MAEKAEKKGVTDSSSTEVLGETYEPGTPQGEDMGKWRQKLSSREEKLKYLENGERYYYGKEWFGSEKRKKPA